MASINLSYTDQTHSSSNKPSDTTLQSDLTTIETAFNALDAAAMQKDGSVTPTANQDFGGQRITNLGNPTNGTSATNLQSVYPVGSIYMNASNATNPATLFGFGTWVALGVGKMLVGFDASDTDFDTAGETGGNKTHTLLEAEMPSHTHTVDPPETTTSSDGAHTHNYTRYRPSVDGGLSHRSENNDGIHETIATTSAGDHTHTVDIAEFDSGSTGSGTAFSLMNPYETVYMWKRTA